MADYSNRILTFTKQDTDVKLQKFLFDLQLKAQQMIDVIAVQKVGSFWYAWFYQKIDLNSVPSAQPEAQIKKKGRRKKAIR